jgi:hypothetical protein
MSEPVTTKRTVVRLRTGATEIVFLHEHDRWRHVVALADGSRIESVEGPQNTAADPRWPASPALTEVSLVGAAGGAAIVGLGLAGRSHFSVSVAAHPDRPDTLLFEVACRIQEPPTWLGSTYRAADGGSMQAAPQAAGTDLPRTVQWSYAVGPDGVVPLPPTAVQPRRP